MARIRDLLEVIYDEHGRDALNALLAARDLSPGRGIDEKLERLARSYRGDMRAFIEDLRLAELRTLAADLMIDGRRYALLRSSKLSRADFVAILGDALADRRFHPDLVPVDGGDDEGTVDADGGWTGDVAADGGGTAASSSGTRRDPFPRVGSSWSGPRQLPRTMQRLGMEVPLRLRTSKFQDLVATLRDAGFEMCLADDYRILRDTDETPGIHARVRLRRTRPREDVVDVGPPQPRTDPIVVPRATPLREPASSAAASEYELALMRLELLTAVPSLQREQLPSWPGAFVEAATRGLKLEPHHRQVLSAVAQQFRRGFHDFTAVASRLRRRIGAHEWNELVDAFERLNADSAEATRVIAQLLRGESTSTASRSEAPQSSSQPIRIQAAREAPAEPPLPHGDPEAIDGRSMGALEDMFD